MWGFANTSKAPKRPVPKNSSYEPKLAAAVLMTVMHQEAQMLLRSIISAIAAVAFLQQPALASKNQEQSVE